ncbi:MAG: hypothetical protein JRI75_10170, partial [Deltaproteobacteria bacterium]|nr:hypothetical protein [Deltaproteobacteria bacterium]
MDGRSRLSSATANHRLFVEYKEVLPMVFNLALYAALAVFALGLIYKISTWFSRSIGISATNFSASDRASAAAKGIAGVV